MCTIILFFIFLFAESNNEKLVNLTGIVLELLIMKVMNNDVDAGK